MLRLESKGKMELKKDEVLHVAKLARIEISEKEMEKFSDELSGILNHIDELDAAKTDGVEVIEQIANLENVTREDKISPSLSNAAVLQNALDKENGFIKVKKIFE